VMEDIKKMFIELKQQMKKKKKLKKKVKKDVFGGLHFK
jgi:hypothetical protein